MAEQSCPKCGTPVPARATACAQCGVLLSTYDEGPTDAAIRTAPEVPKPLAPLPPLKGGAVREAVPSTEMITQIEDTAISREHSEAATGPVPAVPSMTEAETSLIRGRLAGPVPKTPQGDEPPTTPSLPSIEPAGSRATGETEMLPWLNPWVMGVGAMLLIALGLLIGLLLT